MRGEASTEALGAGEPDIVDLETVTIEQVNTGEPEHACELVLMSAFVIVIAKNGNDGNADVFEDIEAGAHLVGHAVVCKIAGDYECICELVDQGKLADCPSPGYLPRDECQRQQQLSFFAPGGTFRRQWLRIVFAQLTIEVAFAPLVYINGKHFGIDEGASERVRMTGVPTCSRKRWVRSDQTDFGTSATWAGYTYAKSTSDQ